MEIRLKYIKIDTMQILIEQMQQFIKEAKNEWEKLIQEGKIFRKKEILEYYKNKITDDNEENKKKRKEIIKTILKARRRNHSFQYLTIYVGKGAREGLKILHEKDSNNRVIGLHEIRNEIERAIMEFNKEHY